MSVHECMWVCMSVWESVWVHVKVCEGVWRCVKAGYLDGRCGHDPASEPRDITTVTSNVSLLTNFHKLNELFVWKCVPVSSSAVPGDPYVTFGRRVTLFSDTSTDTTLLPLNIGNYRKWPGNYRRWPGNDGRQPGNDGRWPGNDGRWPANDGRWPGNDVK